MNISDWETLVSQHLIRSSEVAQATASTCIGSIAAAASMMVDVFRAGKKVLICGNGGSAADAQHLAAEFVNRFRKDFERPALPAIALTTDTSFLTAYANDYGFDGSFERQVLALGKSGDLLLAISTSGNSVNVLRAVNSARERGMKTVGLAGEGGKLPTMVDQAIIIPSFDTQHVQEVMLAVEHSICLLVETGLFGVKEAHASE